MPDETNPVSIDEYVYRRVLKRWYYPVSPHSDDRVDRQAFRPTNRDLDGISVYRAMFTDPEKVARDNEGQLGRYCVARLSVKVISELGLSEANPMHGLLGSCANSGD